MKTIKLVIYKILFFFVKLFYKKTDFIGIENLPEEPCVIIGNHTQMNGPIIGELYFPGKRYIWCAAEMMSCKDVPAYAFKDFWSRKPKSIRWFYKILSYIIAPLSDIVFNNAHTIAVHHNRNVVYTFRETVSRLNEGNNIIIYPEHDVPFNDILCDFQDGFVDVAKMYYKQTKKEISFVPVYIAPTIHSVYIGKPIKYNADNNIKDERRRICDYLKNKITELAVSAPKHKIVPYNNISKKEYKYNKE